MFISRLRFMIFFWALFSCSIFASSDFDISYSPILNGNAENGLEHWSCTNVEVLNEDCSEGERCFKILSSKDESLLCSEPVSIREAENLRLEFQLKSAEGVISNNYQAYVLVRSYASDKKTVLEKTAISLQVNDNKWTKYSYDLNAASGAYYVDVVVKYINNSSDSTEEKFILIDDISLFREIKYSPLYAKIKPLSYGDTLYVYRNRSRRWDNQSIAVQTIQGVTARRNYVKVWVDTGDNTFTDLFADRYGINFDYTYAGDFPGLLKALKQYTSGKYVLYSMRDKASISAATTMAGLLDAVAIDISLEKTAVDCGYKLALDVQGKDCRWVYEKYRERLNHDAIIVHTNDYRDHPSVGCLRDMGPALRAIDWWYPDEKLSREVYRSMSPCSPVYGWQDPVSNDEGVTVQIHSQEGLFQMPSDWMYNLTVHAAFGAYLKDKSFKQLVARNKPEAKKGVHYVTFIMSDMDNILTEIGTNSFFSTKKFYANSNRGKFPMSWGMAPSLAELSPAAVDLWYSNAAKEESFVGYCGLGYFYPSEAPYMQTHIDRLAKFMDRIDLKTLLLIDRLAPEKELSQDYSEHAKWFTSIESLRGLFYMEYTCYAPYGGKIYWFDGKPMVTARFDFREEEFYSAVRSTPEKLASSINSLPKDPSNPDSYTFVTVHAWSKGMDDIYETVKLLDPDVEVVHAEKFIELIRMNLSAH